MNPRRHQEVARAFRRRRRQDRGLEFEKALLLHPPAHGIHDRATGHDVLMQLVSAKVEETVLKPYIFRIFLLACDRQRQLRSRTEHLDLADVDLDRPSRQFRIDRAFGAVAHLAVDPHHPFQAQFFGVLERRRIRIGHALGDAVMVAQVDEQHATMVADDVAPAGQPNRLADMALAKRAAGVGPVTMHGYSKNGCRRIESGGLRLPRKEGEGLPEAVRRGNRMRDKTGP
jgi:hypothetical protein